jgi:hypothetical protein
MAQFHGARQTAVFNINVNGRAGATAQLFAKFCEGQVFQDRVLSMMDKTVLARL